jgi:hypothetical protein
MEPFSFRRSRPRGVIAAEKSTVQSGEQRADSPREDSCGTPENPGWIGID